LKTIKYSLFLLLTLSFLIRIPLINKDLPFFYHEDEAHHHNRIVNMLKTGNLDPEYFHKPSLHFYLRLPVVAAGFLSAVSNGEAYKIEDLKTSDDFGLARYSFTSSHPRVVKINRLLSVFFTLGIILLCFLTTIELTSSFFLALLSSFLCSITPELLENSAIIAVDTPMTFFTLLTTYLGIRVFKYCSISRFLGFSIIAGLAVSCKYNALPIAILPFLTCILLQKKDFRFIFSSLLGPVVGFLIGSPFILFNIPLFLNQFAYEIWHYGVAGHQGHMTEPGFKQAFFYTKWMSTAGTGLIALIFSIIGTYSLIKNKFKLSLITLIFPILFLTLMINQKTNFTRNMIVLIPYFSILTAFGLKRIYDLNYKFKNLLAPLILLQPLILSIILITNISFQKPESRTLASSFIINNLNSNSNIALDGELQLPLLIKYTDGKKKNIFNKVTRFDPNKNLNFDFINNGFTHLVTSNIYKNDSSFFKLIKSFDGSIKEQRIVKNPLINIYQFQVSSDLINFTSTNFDIIKENSNLSYNTSKGFENCPESLKEDTSCYLNKRFNWISTNNFLKNNQSIEIDFFSPWENKLKLITSEKVFTPILTTDKKVIFDIKDTSLLSNGFIIYVENIFNPKHILNSEDDRELGVLIKNIKFKNLS